MERDPDTCLTICDECVMGRCRRTRIDDKDCDGPGDWYPFLIGHLPDESPLAELRELLRQPLPVKTINPADYGLGFRDDVGTAREVRAVACIHRGRCHGPVTWCAICGDTVSTCDDRNCDLHVWEPFEDEHGQWTIHRRRDDGVLADPDTGEPVVFESGAEAAETAVGLNFAPDMIDLVPYVADYVTATATGGGGVLDELGHALAELADHPGPVEVLGGNAPPTLGAPGEVRHFLLLLDDEIAAQVAPLSLVRFGGGSISLLSGSGFPRHGVDLSTLFDLDASRPLTPDMVVVDAGIVAGLQAECEDIAAPDWAERFTELCLELDPTRTEK